MQKHIQQLADRIDAMELRQRVMLLVTALALLFFMADTFAIQPLIMKQKEGRQTITDLELKLELLRQRTGLLSSNPDDGTSSLHNEMLAQLATLDRQIQERIGGLLAPAHAIKVLEQVLEQEQGLELLEVDAGSSPLTGVELPGEENLPAAGIGRYQLQMQLEGSYLATLRYLHALENLPWKFFWESVDYQVTNYPNARITLDLYTLGLAGGRS